ncbi:hypothetical protein ACHAXH_008874 [Discostella pseudostelligera]
MVNFLEYVSSQERKRKLRNVRTPKEKMPPEQKRGSLVCGTVKTPIGSRVAKIKSRVLKRITKNDSALHKHVKWLKDLQDERRRMEDMKEAEELEILTRKRAFMEREAKKRAVGKLESIESSTDEKDSDDGPAASSRAIASKELENEKKKPAWCQSETAHEAAEIDNEANLLSFVNGLDFEQYTHDLELQTLMDQLRKRIKMLELEKKKDETKLKTCLDSEDAAQRSEALGDSVVDFVPTEVEKVDEDDGDAADDTKSKANSVMSESSIKSIHSKKSLTELISKARGRMMVMATIEEEGEDAILPPVVSTVTDDNGARMAEKKSIHKLAFKNRHPSV